MQPQPYTLCPRCHQPLSTERIACRSCGSSHHSECWVHGRGCARYVCGSNPTILPPPVLEGRRVLRALRAPVAMREPAGSSLAAGIAAAAACVAFGLIAWLGRDLHPATPPEDLTRDAPALSIAALVRPAASLYVRDVVLDLPTPPTTATITWTGDRPYTPTFRMGRDVPDRELELIPAGARYKVALPALEPGASYVYRIGGLPGGAAHEGRFTAPPPGDAAGSRLRTKLLDLPDGMAMQATTFGPARLARPLWGRESALAAELVAAGGRVILHDGRHALAIDATDGGTVWTHPVPWPGVPPRPVCAAGVVVLATPEGPLALDVETGRPRWRLPLPGMRALFAVGDEVYVHVPEAPARLHRVQAADGRLVAILALPGVPHHVQVAANHVVVRIDEPGAARGEALVRSLDRLRGEQRWERLWFGADLPVLPPVAHGDRLYAALADRLELRGLANAAVLARWTFPAPPLLVVPTPDGGALVGTGGPVPRAHLLGPDLALRRSWTLPGAPLRGIVEGERAVLTDADGLQILELVDGPRWGLTGLPPARHLALTPQGHLIGQLSPVPGSPFAERLVVLGLRGR